VHFRPVFLCWLTAQHSDPQAVVFKIPETVSPADWQGYRRRWKIERLLAWLNAFKRTIARWDRFHENFTAFVLLAFSMILLRRVVKEL